MYLCGSKVDVNPLVGDEVVLCEIVGGYLAIF